MGHGARRGRRQAQGGWAPWRSPQAGWWRSARARRPRRCSTSPTVFALYVGGMGARGKNFYNDLACQYGYEKEAKEIQDLYLGGNKRDAEAKVPLEWLEATNLVGPASYVQERIAAYAEAGVTNLMVQPVSEDPAAVVQQLKEWVG